MKGTREKGVSVVAKETSFGADAGIVKGLG